LNRFGSFVTSGAEGWVLKGAPEDPDAPVVHHRITSEVDEDDQPSNFGMGESDVHYVDGGPSWKAKVPPFRILVHSPSKRTSTLAGAYTVYTVTSMFQPETVEEDGEPSSPTRITVHRRFSHFVALHTALSRRLPGIALPPIPDKQYAGRFSGEFVEARRGDLERYLDKVVRHPLARYAEVLTFFLSCENETVRLFKFLCEGLFEIETGFDRNGDVNYQSIFQCHRLGHRFMPMYFIQRSISIWTKLLESQTDLQTILEQLVKEFKV
jgi:sorting nexin-9/18/33